MPEDLAGLDAPETPESGASAQAPITTPAPVATDIEKMRAEMDERIKGFQRLVSEREAELNRLRAQDEERRIATLPEDERTAYERSQYAKEVEKLRTENEVLRAAAKYPDIYPKYDSLMRAPTAEEQFKLLASWSGPVAAPSPTDTEPAPADKPAPVDRNNPPAKRGKTMVNGYEMDDAIAQNMLKSITTWPRS